MASFVNLQPVTNQAGVQNIQGGLHYYAPHKSDADNQCLRDLRLNDPRDDKTRILQSKDDLLEESCSWAFRDPAFVDWRESDKAPILWIHGDPGKGKTMMMMAFIKEISRHLQRGPNPRGVLAYFFCQSTVHGLNDAVSVLRGLIYILAVENTALIQHVRKKYDSAGSRLFEGSNALFALWTILMDILRDPNIPQVYLLLDALDECTLQQRELLSLITGSEATRSSKAKWLVTSRNELMIKEQLNLHLHTSLELNSAHVSHAVMKFIDSKVHRLSQSKGYDIDLQNIVRNYLAENANGTFLWVALVCKELQNVQMWLTRSVLQTFPPGLDPLYGRMLNQICRAGNIQVQEYCRRILSAVTLAYRPLHLVELGFAAELPHDIYEDQRSLRDLVSSCGSFLSIRNDTVYFVHQSAQDYLRIGKGSSIFPSGLLCAHGNVARRSLDLMSNTLKRDICQLGQPGITDIQSSLVDRYLPRHIQYACCYWVSHLLRAHQSPLQLLDLCHDYKVHSFFHRVFLYWLEALSLIRKVSDGVIAIMDLESELLSQGDTQLLAMAHDARRFVLSYRSAIEAAPLQIYYSALLFCPTRVKRMFSEQAPRSIKILGAGTEEEWSQCLQTLEGHRNYVRAVVFSPDGSLVASGSDDGTVRLWDARTGAARATLEGHSGYVQTVVFSPDGSMVASGSSDRTVRLWDVRTGAARATLEGHRGHVNPVVFSPDGSLVASGSSDRTVRLWDARTGAARATLEGHSEYVQAVIFSPDGSLVASGSNDGTVRLWDARTGAARATLEGHRFSLRAVVFSPDGSLVASGSGDGTVRLWDARTGAARATLEGHRSYVQTVVFSPDGSLVASGSSDRTVRLWDARTGAARATLEGHSGSVQTVVFSPDGSLVASGSSDRTVRLWDARTGAARATLEGHYGYVQTVVFSPDGSLVASGSSDRTVRLWDARTEAARPTLEGHRGHVFAVVFSPDSSLVASGSFDCTVRLWDARTGAARATLEGHSGFIRALVFSPDSSLVASGSDDCTVRLWDARTGAARATLEGHSGSVYIVVFSPDGSLVASESDNNAVRLWDTRTGAARATLEGHSGSIFVVVFSPDGSLVASGSNDCTVRLWDARTGAARATLEGHYGYVHNVVFSPDGSLVASESDDCTVRLWDARTGNNIRIIESKSYNSELSFTPDSSRLNIGKAQINTGVLSLKTPSPKQYIITRLYSIDDTGSWVLFMGAKILWIPPDRRPSSFAVRNNNILLGSGSGRMTFLSLETHIEVSI